MQIYVHRDNQQTGPFTEDEIKAQLAAGTVTLQDHVWWQGQANWLPLGQTSLITGAAPAPGVTPAIDAYPVGTIPPTSSMAVWALVLGCLSFFFSILTAIPAIVLGHLSLNKIKKNPGMKGHGMAMAGTILGYVFTALLPVISIIAISVLIALGNQVKGTFQTINSQLQEAQSTNSADDSSSTNTDQSTNAPDQSAPATTPDQSTNSAPMTPATPDQSTNSATTTPPSSDSSTNPPAPVNAPPTNQ